MQEGARGVMFAGQGIPGDHVMSNCTSHVAQVPQRDPAMRESPISPAQQCQEFYSGSLGIEIHGSSAWPPNWFQSEPGRSTERFGSPQTRLPRAVCWLSWCWDGSLGTGTPPFFTWPLPNKAGSGKLLLQLLLSLYICFNLSFAFSHS